MSPGLTVLRMRERGDIPSGQQEACKTRLGRNQEQPKGSKRNAQSRRKDLVMASREGSPKTTRTKAGNNGIRVNSRKEKNKGRLSGTQIFLVLVLLLLFMGSGIGYVWSTFESTKIGYDISKLKRQELNLIEMNRKLRAELAFLKSPERLERKAIKKFGLREPKSTQIVILP